MSRFNSMFRLIALCLLLAGYVGATEKKSAAKTVAETYPFLVSGVLIHARVVALPEDVIARSGDVVLRKNDLGEAAAEAPLAIRKDFDRDPFPLLERQLAYRLIVSLAKEDANRNQTGETDERRLLQQYIDRITVDIKPSDADIKEFYEQNRTALGNQALEKIKDYVATVVADELRAEHINQTIRDLGRERRIEVAADWLKKHAAKALDNAVDRVRGKGKPVLAVFSGAGCCGPDLMKPVVENVRKAAGERVVIVYIEASRNQALAMRHRISGIPTSIIFDAAGVETTRRQGAVKATTILEWLGLNGKPSAP